MPRFYTFRMASSAVCVISRRTHSPPIVPRHPKLGRSSSIEQYQSNIIEQIRGNLETNRKLWEKDIKQPISSPQPRRNARIAQTGANIVHAVLLHSSADDFNSGNVPAKTCVISLRQFSRQNGITQWTIKVNVQNKLPEDCLSVRLDSTSVHLKTEMNDGKLEEVIQLGETGTVLPETLKVQASSLNTLTIRVCTKS